MYTADEEDVEQFYGELASLTRQIPKHNLLIIGGDFNMEPGSDEFESLTELLEDEKFYMVSDGKTATYKTGSVLDHIFVREKTKIVESVITLFKNS